MHTSTALQQVSLEELAENLAALCAGNVSSRDVEIRGDTRVKTQHGRPGIFVFDERRREAVLVEVGITSSRRCK